jgi:hypothetical protein
MREVDALADVLPEGRVLRPRSLVAVEELDEPDVHHCLGEREEGIDPGVALVRQRGPLALVQLGPLRVVDRAQAVDGPPRRPVAVGLEDVAVQPIHDQATNPERRVIVERPDRFGVTLVLDQLLQGGPDRELFDLRLVVQRQRVVHVEPDHLDLRELQVAVDVHP